MKKTTLIAALSLGIIVCSFQWMQSAIWSADKAHSRLGFSVPHLLISDVDGSFKTFTCKITSAKPDFSDAVIELNAETNSISTDNDQRDTHLKSADFFDVQKYPALSFTSTSLQKVEGTKYKLTGDLTIHGITKKVELDATINGPIVHPSNKKTMAGLKITGTINRKDFGIAPSMAGAMVGEKIAINANGEFVKE